LEEEISLHLHVQHLISHYGYIGVFFTLLVEMIGVPFPVKTILIISGFEWMKGTFSLAPLLLSACLGNIMGSTIAYVIGYYRGRPVIVRFGRYVGLTEDKLNAVEKKFTHYRKTVVLFAKFFTGVRVLVPYLSGINRMPFPRFTVYNAVGAVVWAAFFIIVGRYVEVAWSHSHKVMHQYMLPLIILVVLVLSSIMAIKIRGKNKRKDKH
jgi:membrane protein DedA with SNARE-associated domain